MPNSFYNHGTYPTPNSPGSSAALRAELEAITDGFDLMPTLSGNGYKVAMVNSAGTALIASSALQSLAITSSTIDSTPIGATTRAAGNFTTLSATGAASLGSSVTIGGGVINGTTIGATTPSSGAFTTLSVSGGITSNLTGNVTAGSGTSTFSNVTINGTLDMNAGSVGTITGLATPTLDSDAANKAYVDTVAQGLDAKASCRAATTANITLSGTQTIDGVSVIAGDRVLVKDQSTASENGIYVAAAGGWSRAADADAWAELVSAFVFVEDGTANADNGYVCTVAAGGTLGSTSVTWVQFSGAGQVTAGTGMTKTGNTLNVNTASASRIVVGADEIDLAATGVSAGTYRSVTVDLYGRVTSGTNPTTISGYGITDAYTKTEVDTLFGSTTSAAASASAAAASAIDASNFATAASGSASAALTSANNAAASYDAFDDRYLGSKTSDPTLDNDGNALLTGALYWNSTAGEMRVYTGSVWQAAYLPAAGYLPLSGGTMTGSITFAGGQTFPGTLVSSDIGVTVQAYDADLTAWAGKTAPTGVAVGTTDTQTLTNKTISGSANTITNVSLTAGVTGTLPAANGGTGQSSYAVGDLLFASTTTALSKLADVATGNALISGGVGVAPSYGKIGLTTHVSGTLAVGNGGTGLTTGTSGGIPYFSAASTIASSAALAANALVVGGGAGGAPATVTTGTGVVTALGVAVGSAGAFVTNGGALGTPSSGTVTNLTGTASININGTVGATTANTGAFTSVTSTSAAGVLTRAAATQDGVEMVGRAGGSTSLKVTLTPTTLTASRTLTLPDNSGTVLTTGATVTVAQGGTGATTLTGILKGNGTSAFTAATANTDYVTSTGADGLFTRWMFQDTGWDFFDSSTTNALDYVNGSVQRWAPNTGAQTLSISNWPPSGAMGELLIQGVNLGAATITWPTINWIKSDGTTTTTFSSNGATLQASGTDWVLIWTRDGGTTLFGKVVR